ncbi:RloB family protein [Mucilaginibacter lacusdianchii]|uniref:RloB family protein n=1 Tax=Mucilaginibacter lacusdianchii TaxID=2684211 RepID=UPI00131AE379|nr:RloB family protein [Mucilaginibacter sp. JXJ CY 39]
MAEQWELQTSDERSADQILNFIIFCEDEVSEPYYFSSLEVSGKSKINCLPNQKQGKLNLDNTIAYCREGGLIVFDQNGYRVNAESTENIWCVYDRDMEDTDFEKIKVANHIAFDTAIQTAGIAGINVAWSNDAFELWILLHFEEVSTETMLHREYIYERLTALFKTLHPDNEDFQAMVAHPQFYYKNILKKKQPFITYVLPVLHDRTEQAIARANNLEANFNHNIAFHLRNPCTQVHHLVKLILS